MKKNKIKEMLAYLEFASYNGHDSQEIREIADARYQETDDERFLIFI